MITSTVNPAALLTANRIPYSSGSGRLANSCITVDPAANGNLTIAPDGTGQVVLKANSIAGSRADGSFSWQLGTGGTVITFGSRAATHFAFATNDVERGRFTHTDGRFLLGTSTDSANGLFQLASHSAMTGGISFGTSATGTETLWRESAGKLKTSGTIHAANFEIDANFLIGGVTRINATQPAWTTIGTIARNWGGGAETLARCGDAIGQIISDLKAIGIFA